jgi:hypothetical protein
MVIATPTISTLAFVPTIALPAKAVLAIIIVETLITPT